MENFDTVVHNAVMCLKYVPTIDSSSVHCKSLVKIFYATALRQWCGRFVTPHAAASERNLYMLENKAIGHFHKEFQ